MGFFADLFSARTYTCETCAALKYTISLQKDEIEYLRGMLDDERVKYRVGPPPEPIKPNFEQNIRKSRVPWSRKQAQLESRSAREAAEQEREAWKRRVAAADAADATGQVSKPAVE